MSPPGARSDTTATAPAATASAAKARPSDRVPGTAKNAKPGAAARLSVASPRDGNRAPWHRQAEIREELPQGHRSAVSMPIPSFATNGNGAVGKFRLGGRLSKGATRSMTLLHTSPAFQAAV